MRGITWKLVAMDNMVNNGVAKAVYTDYMPKALTEGSYVAAPEPEIVGKGVESVQAAYKHQEK